MKTIFKSKHWLIIAGIMIILVVIATVAIYMFVSFASGMCGTEILATADSPDGKLTAVVFKRDCGATTAHSSTQVSLIQKGEELPNESGNAVISASDSGLGGGPDFPIKWTGTRTLVVGYDSRIHPIKHKKSVGIWIGFLRRTSVEIEYYDDVSN